MNKQLHPTWGESQIINLTVFGMTPKSSQNSEERTKQTCFARYFNILWRGLGYILLYRVRVNAASLSFPCGCLRSSEWTFGNGGFWQLVMLRIVASVVRNQSRHWWLIWLVTLAIILCLFSFSVSTMLIWPGPHTHSVLPHGEGFDVKHQLPSCPGCELTSSACTLAYNYEKKVAHIMEK